MEIPKSLNSFYFNDKKIDLNNNPANNISINDNINNSDKIDIKFFKIFTDKHKIKVSSDIKVPKDLKKIWNELIKDGVLTMNDYQKIINSSMKLKSCQENKCQEFIKIIGDKLQENKGVISFIDNKNEISLNELKELLK